MPSLNAFKQRLNEVLDRFFGPQCLREQGQGAKFSTLDESEKSHFFIRMD